MSPEQNGWHLADSIFISIFLMEIFSFWLKFPLMFILYGQSNRIWWLCLIPTSTTRFPSDLGCSMAKNLIGLYKEILFMNNQIPYHRVKNTIFTHKFWRPFLIAKLSYFFRPKYYGFWYFSSQILVVDCRTNCSYHFTRVDLYSHQVLLIRSHQHGCSLQIITFTSASFAQNIILKSDK